MEINRHIQKYLEQWKVSSNRKPLILRGARQVGKTTLVNTFSKSYSFSIHLNLERKSDFEFFESFEDVKTLLNAIFLANNIPAQKLKETLLFIDEIQESPKAIAMLRYFYEDEPELHVIAAGSLLEHAMDKVKSFPVGRVQYLYIHPISFIEFLEAAELNEALQEMYKIPIAEYAHPILLKAFHEYTLIGGMPEIVKTYLKNKSLSDLQIIYESIWTSYKEDIEKYGRNKNLKNVLRHIMNTAPLYLDQRIKFQNFGNSNYKSREVSEAFKDLNDAKVIQLIYPTTSIENPLIPDLKKAPRLQFLDTGLINYSLKIQSNMLAIEDLSFAYKGAVIPHIINQEIISQHSINYTKPNFWVREKNQSSAEVDLVIPFKNKLIPIEVKSGTAGKLKSLHQFIDKADHNFAMRFYAGRFSIEEHKTPIKKKNYLLMNLPYYLGTQIDKYLEYFMRTVELYE